MEQFNSEMFFRTETENIRGFLYKDYSIKRHTHDFYEINIIMSGRGKHIIKDRTFDADVGNVFVIPPMIPHGYTDTEKLDVFHMLIKTAFIEKLTDKNKVEGIEMLVETEPYLRQNYGSEYFLKLSGSKMVYLKNQLYSLLDGGELDYEGSDPVKNHEAIKILYLLAHYMVIQTKLKDSRMPEDKNEAVVAAIKFIHENYKEKIYIYDLCKISFMSASTLTRQFKRMCGCSPIEYLRRFRIEKALELLKRNKNKTYVAQECGFYDLSHMEKSIKLCN